MLRRNKELVARQLDFYKGFERRRSSLSVVFAVCCTSRVASYCWLSFTTLQWQFFELFQGRFS